MALEDIRGERIKKLQKLLEAGLEPYPASVRAGKDIFDVLKNFSTFVKQKKNIFLVGRVMAKREHGGSTFADIKRGESKIQLFFKEDALGVRYRLFLETVDVGDFLEVCGLPFSTKRGEPTLEVSEWRIISKSLRPLPEKWHGLQDVEERFRKRYLDLLMNEDVRRRFRMRSEITSCIRNYLEKDAFIEVETPMLQGIPGGALAKPFKTHHNALGVDFYLRIAPELYLKKLLVGGMEKVFELGKSFRNEGVDVTHNPEFTTMEWYASFWDEEEMMGFTERIVRHIFAHIKKKKFAVSSSEFEYDGKVIHVKAPFPRVQFADLLRRHVLIADYEAETRDSLALKAQRFGIDVSAHESKGKIADEIYKKICRPHLVNPTFVTNHPVDISPLAKKVSRGAGTVRRFQLVIGGLELVNAFAELNDPLDQRERFEAQERMKTAGEEETHPLDESFIEALEYGMPPAAGAAISIDRLAMFLTNSHNIKEVIAFPTLKPK